MYMHLFISKSFSESQFSLCGPSIAAFTDCPWVMGNCSAKASHLEVPRHDKQQQSALRVRRAQFFGSSSSWLLMKYSELSKKHGT